MSKCEFISHHNHITSSWKKGLGLELRLGHIVGIPLKALGHGSYLLNNSSVVSAIHASSFVDPPNEMMTLKSGPEPSTVAECPSRGVILAGRATCTIIQIYL